MPSSEFAGKYHDSKRLRGECWDDFKKIVFDTVGDTCQSCDGNYAMRNSKRNLIDILNNRLSLKSAGVLGFAISVFGVEVINASFRRP